MSLTLPVEELIRSEIILTPNQNGPPAFNFKPSSVSTSCSMCPSGLLVHFRAVIEDGKHMVSISTLPQQSATIDKGVAIANPTALPTNLDVSHPEDNYSGSSPVSDEIDDDATAAVLQDALTFIDNNANSSSFEYWDIFQNSLNENENLPSSPTFIGESAAISASFHTGTLATSETMDPFLAHIVSIGDENDPSENDGFSLVPSSDQAPFSYDYPSPTPSDKCSLTMSIAGMSENI
ncbi:hypothetical protein VKT23_014911 [Stygiomarasmius scandens]|uniref:Uncharacterized protein n=1 Tax=Marasmiellus scandens TaxID=2682957 RepID=A0ABR1J2T6_9AGAR